MEGRKHGNILMHSFFFVSPLFLELSSTSAATLHKRVECKNSRDALANVQSQLYVTIYTRPPIYTIFRITHAHD